MTFWNPVSIEFGNGSLDRVDAVLGRRRCIVVTTPGMAARGVLERLLTLCGERVAYVYRHVSPNPTLDSISTAVSELSCIEAEVIVALGGGSAIDTAKAIAAARQSSQGEGWLREHLEGGGDFPDHFAPMPTIAIPTTAGTGSEVTKWATVWNPARGRKYSLCHPALFPERAIVDPELTLTQSRELTVNSALDALSHALEAIWNHNANPISDALAARVIAILPEALRAVCDRGDDLCARAALHEASVLAGLASSGTRTAIAHSMSYALTLSLGMPHGLACAIALPEILRCNGEAFPERARLIGEALGVGSLGAAVKALYRLLEDVRVPLTLGRYLSSASQLEKLGGELLHPGRAENNLVAVSSDRARSILVDACRHILRAPLRRVAVGGRAADTAAWIHPGVAT